MGRFIACCRLSVLLILSITGSILGQVKPGTGASRPGLDSSPRAKANRLADEGKYTEAIAELRAAVNKGDSGAQLRLNDLEEEARQRTDADRFRGARRFGLALKAATAALDLKDKRHEHRVPRTPADESWLRDLRNGQTSSEADFSQEDLKQIREREYRDKWFDYQAELHDGGVMADAVAEARRAAERLNAQKGSKDPETIAAQSRASNAEEERSALMAQLRRTIAARDQAAATGQTRQANDLTAVIVQLKQRAYGPGDLTLAISLGERARFEQQLGGWNMAQAHFDEAQKIFSGLYGPSHWRTKDAQVAVDQASAIQRESTDTARRIRTSRSRALEAAKLLERGRQFDALDLATQDEARFLGYANERRYAGFAANQACLATIYRTMGRFREAQERQRRALDVLGELYGERHPDYVVALNTFYELCVNLGDRARALATARRSLELTEAVWGATHGEYAVSLNNLGEAELAGGRVEPARDLFIRALKLSEQHFAAYGQLWTTSLQNLAEVHRLAGEYGESARLLRHVLKNRESGYGPGHPTTLDALHSLASLEIDAKNYDSAAELLSKLFEASRVVHGPKHMKRAQYLSTLARLHRARAKDDEAEPLLREALEIARANLDSTFAALSERQQLAMTRDAQRMLFAYLDLTAARKRPAEQAYPHVLAWKGAVLGRQQQARFATDEPQLRPLLNDYQETSRRLATVALISVSPSQKEALDAEATALSGRRERLEAELSAKSDKFRQSRTPLTVDGLTELLPGDGALVDFLEFTSSSPGDGQPVQRLTAFIVRRGRHVEQVDLGNAAPLRALGEQWRAEIQRGRGGVDRGLKVASAAKQPQPATPSPQTELRRLLWEPLEPLLAGVKLLLVSPDGVTAQLPLGALPDREGRRYLIEELPMVLIPSSSQLAFALAGSSATASSTMSLLTLGDVDFGASPGKGRMSDEEAALAQRAVPRFANAVFGPLPGTGREARSIAALFRDRFPKGALSELSGAEATEGRLREAGPGCRYLHLATHGFFAPDLLRAASANEKSRAEVSTGETIAELHPGLLSGIALAGANPGGTPAAPGRSGELTDDGVLTALEVAALDLRRVELATLSACESGLGQSAGGEGLLGLQRSFQVAGVRTTVASLWKVDDAATQVLMTEFYRNLWERNLGKLEALRQAQLKMLREYDTRQQKLVSRGLKAVATAPSEEPASLSPYYWAAFVLSGDWR